MVPGRRRGANIFIDFSAKLFRTLTGCQKVSQSDKQRGRRKERQQADSLTYQTVSRAGQLKSPPLLEEVLLFC